MTGPKRGISMRGEVLIEYDMRIKKEEHQDDLQLIDGVSAYDKPSILGCHPFVKHIHGVGGAVDITLAMFYWAVEATIQVDTTRVNGSGSRLLLSSFVSGLEEEIRLFHGSVRQLPERFVLSTVLDTWMHLKFKFGDERGSHTNEFERCASFKARQHGCASQQIKLDDEDYIMVKVTWSTF
ncbi:hypothetical protein PR202_gb16619 [Eleusine coracana subsp. coracana]|uniref:DUF6598 domain-containing protein n=1 Tax=Eleusine coracana subsp. coracana TaxID=191504 RepID=A0AAV5F0T3_ELECO|nr:hypothetical protein PR202_gb16619 [Eleusine coracana subsp. coracana]